MGRLRRLRGPCGSGARRWLLLCSLLVRAGGRLSQCGCQDQPDAGPGRSEDYRADEGPYDHMWGTHACANAQEQRQAKGTDRQDVPGLPRHMFYAQFRGGSVSDAVHGSVV